MNHQDIIAHLCQLQPHRVVHEITTENVISEIVRRRGEEALELSAGDLELATPGQGAFLFLNQKEK